MNLVARACLVLGVLGGCATAGQAAAAAVEAVPLVRCASDGQMGPQPAPKGALAIPRLPSAQAERLAYYASEGLGVLAPRGWHCIGLVGSNGAMLIVTPERHGADLLEPGHPLKGPAVERISRSSETSGRFEVADAAAELFPAAKTFVRAVAAEGIEPLKPWKLSAADHVIFRTGSRLEFVTEAGRQGLGTKGNFAPSGEPIHGGLSLDPDEGLMMVNVRLAPADAALAAPIVRQAGMNPAGVTQ